MYCENIFNSLEVPSSLRDKIKVQHPKYFSPKAEALV